MISKQKSEVLWGTSAFSRFKKATMSKLKVKTMLIVFFDFRGLVHNEFALHGRTINFKLYVEVLKKLI